MNALALGAALLGHADGAGSGPGGRSGQVGGVEAPCTVSSEIIGVEDTSRLGFSANDVVSAISGARSAPLRWTNGGSTTVTVSPGAPRAARLVRLTRPGGQHAAGGDGPVGPVATSCPGGAPLLEIDVPLRFSTEDGAFIDSFSVTLQAGRVDAVSYIHVIHPREIQGSYRVVEVDPAEIDRARLVLLGTISRSTITGKLKGSALGEPSASGEGPGARGRSFDVAEF